MNQKWNLQDIQPARPRKAAKPVRPVNEETEIKTQNDEPVSDIKIKRDTNSENNSLRERMRRRPGMNIDKEASLPEKDTHFDTVEIVDGRKSRQSSYVIAGIVFIFVVLGGVVASALMGGADITVKPRHTDKNIAATFTGSIVAKEDTLLYELLTLEADGERQVEAKGQEEVTEQAQGTILVYNEFSPNPVRLVKNTRFQSPDGLIYKIKESAVVPGYSKGDSGSVVPGVITADVFAEATGEKYNIGPARFTIPGFEGSAEYDKVYGESTGSMIGGFSGQKFIIDDAELETARQALHTELRDALLARLENERPADFVLYNDAVTFSFNSLPAIAYGDNLATIKEQGVLRVPLFKEADLAKFLAEKSVPNYEGLPVRLTNYNTLTFAYTSPTTTISDISAESELSFSLTGNAQIVWQFNENELKADLLGVEKTAISQILGKYPAIESAEAVVRPFWKTSFPREMREIDVTEKLD